MNYVTLTLTLTVTDIGKNQSVFSIATLNAELHLWSPKQVGLLLYTNISSPVDTNS